MLEIVMSLLKELEGDKPHMPPTMLYNEGWLLRIILHWFYQTQVTGHAFSFLPQAGWYSEGLLSSKFQSKHQGDPLGESYTRADGVLGHLAVGDKGRGDIFLIEPFRQFIVMEAKLFSRLSGSTTRVPGFNQVARNIACMASVAERSGCSVERFQSLCFHVLAPKDQIEKEASFKKYVQKDAVRQVVRQRVETYKGRPDYDKKKKWFGEHFEPLLSKIKVSLISWEIVIDSIKKHDNEAGEGLARFYDLCLEFNSPKS